MPGGGRALVVVGLLASLMLSSTVLALPGPTSVASGDSGSSTGALTSRAAGPASGAVVSTTAATGSVGRSAQFDQTVLEEASGLTAAGVPASDVRIPNVGTPAKLVDGVVVPGYGTSATNVSSPYVTPPAPSGISYYGENNTTGTTQARTLDASSVDGTVAVAEIDTLYLGADAPDLYSIQLNAVLGNVTLLGQTGYEYWVQNVAEVYEHNSTINLGDDTWNMSTPGAYVPSGPSTILSHGPNGAVVEGVYLAYGPWIYAPQPFNLSLYLNSSLTSSGNQELWYNYSLVAAHGIRSAGSYDWFVLDSGGPSSGASVAPLVASGTQLTGAGLTEDYELDFPIGGFNGETMDVLSANATATLTYCPIARASCSTAQYRSVPAAVDFGADTGETASGVLVTYSGTTASVRAGPYILRGLWGYPAAAGSAAGATVVTNRVTVAGSPEVASTTPYVFVFFSTNSTFDPELAWAPDVPDWYLAPGTYQYEVMLADYAEQNGTLTVGATPTALSVVLPYHRTSGVYTPLWAFSDAQLAGISSTGNGTLGSDYVLFNNPTLACTLCGGARNGNVSSAFYAPNGNLYPTYAGILLAGTDAYVDVEHPVSFCSRYVTWGPVAVRLQTSDCFDLQLEFVSTEHVTLADDLTQGSWPGVLETFTTAGTVDGAENPFPAAQVMFWNSSDDLVMGSDFAPGVALPTPPQECVGVCPPVTCVGCAPLDALLLYGGTNNTIWGNTFHDPGSSRAAPVTHYAGLVEAESGDLIYNNNFSIDNPVVYLPFDFYTDNCPIGYAGGCGPLVPPAYSDTWNVSFQASANVSATVNGFSLSGNVLGPTCGEQGGNYWNDYGNTLNPLGQLPFVNRYDYPEILSLLPPGSSADQASILVGGDYLPLTWGSCTLGTKAEVRFHETGLPVGTGWTVEVGGGYLGSSSTPWIDLTVPAGTLPFNVVAPGGYGVAHVGGPREPTYTSANVTGTTTIGIAFGTFETVLFTESVAARWPGLPANTTWSVSLTPAGHGGPPPQTNSTNGSEVGFTVPKGAAYRFVVSTAPGYVSQGGKGTFTVPPRPLTKPVRFRLFTATVRFVEHGLPARTNWSVNVTPLDPAGPNVTLTGRGSALVIALPNGTYAFTIAAVGAKSPTPGTGNFTVDAPHARTIVVRFALKPSAALGGTWRGLLAALGAPLAALEAAKSHL